MQMPFFQIPDDTWEHDEWSLTNYDFDTLAAIHIHVEDKQPIIQVLQKNKRKGVTARINTVQEAVGLVERFCAKSPTPFVKLGKQGDWVNPRFSSKFSVVEEYQMVGFRDSSATGYYSLYLRPTNGYIDQMEACYLPSVSAAREILALITCKNETGPEALP